MYEMKYFSRGWMFLLESLLNTPSIICGCGGAAPDRTCNHRKEIWQLLGYERKVEIHGTHFMEKRI